ncbi:hydroxymethylbilane synthase [Streptomyces sp. NPDC057557]|uniref:hydroxymethylbilane synthase n=1 Tax=Streptomyces sp. NPDC057557 TaxID=3346167 RepID=UPI0036A5437C
MTATATRSVRLGTRPSPMAMEQTTRFAAAFRDRYPDISLGIVTITSEGDRHRGPLAEIGGKGAFTRRADQRLLDGSVEAAIACAKDLPSAHDRAPGITVAAVLPREDVRDMLVLPEDSPAVTLAELPAGTRVGTSAPRRAALLRALHPHLVAVPIRGNADSRLAHLDDGTLGVDAVIAALAGLRRLNRTGRVAQILDPTLWLPAAGAGIMVVECRTDDHATARLLGPLTHSPTRLLLDAERAALAALHGNCLTAASVHAVHDQQAGTVTVHATVLDPDGVTPVTTAATGPVTGPAGTGQRAGHQTGRGRGPAPGGPPMTDSTAPAEVSMPPRDPGEEERIRHAHTTAATALAVRSHGPEVWGCQSRTLSRRASDRWLRVVGVPKGQAGRKTVGRGCDRRRSSPPLGIPTTAAQRDRVDGRRLRLPSRAVRVPAPPGPSDWWPGHDERTRPERRWWADLRAALAATATVPTDRQAVRQRWIDKHLHRFLGIPIPGHRLEHRTWRPALGQPHRPGTGHPRLGRMGSHAHGLRHRTASRP